MWTHFYCAGTLNDSVMLSTFAASVRAVGTAATLAAAGLWLARRGLMTPQLSKGLSQLSVKLAIPALLFGSVVPGMSYDVFDYAWPLFVLPAVYLLIGVFVGLITLAIVRPPTDFRLGTVAACTFGNTTGIPVVVLSVLQQSLSRSVFADVADPLLFLSMALVTFPVLQWVIGLVLIAIFKRDGKSNSDGLGDSDGGTGMQCLGGCCCFGLCAGCVGSAQKVGWSLPSEDASEVDLLRQQSVSRPIRRREESTSYISMMSQGEDAVVPYEAVARRESVSDRLYSLGPSRKLSRRCCRALREILLRIMVPQAIGIVGGGLVGLFGRHFVLPVETAPLGWLYLGITKLGAAAVPINLILLGAALSRTPERRQVPGLTAAGIVIARMVFMPLCGILVARLLSDLNLTVPYMVADPFWLVCLVLTSTPTANNTVVMCDIAGENRRAMSAAIFYQYCAAPLLLPGVLTVFIAFICRQRHETDL